MKAILSLLVTMAAVVPAQKALACDCAAEDVSIDQAYERAPTVFIGTVTRIEREESEDDGWRAPAMVTFAIEKTYKGENESRVVIEDPGSCFGVGFKESERYLVWAGEGIDCGQADYAVDNCGRTRLASQASDDLAWLEANSTFIDFEETLKSPRLKPTCEPYDASAAKKGDAMKALVLSLAIGLLAANANARIVWRCEEDSRPGDGNLERIELDSKPSGKYDVIYTMLPGGEVPDDQPEPQPVRKVLGTELPCKFAGSDERLVSCSRSEGTPPAWTFFHMSSATQVRRSVDSYDGEIRTEREIHVELHSPEIKPGEMPHPEGDAANHAVLKFSPEDWQVNCGRVN